MAFEHKPVLLQETVGLLADMPGSRFVDGTLGAGGHASALLALRSDVEAIGIDRDPSALEAACARLSQYGARFRGVRGRFSEMGRIVRDAGWEKVDGILLDLGVSSPQIDTPERGFSFRANGPLDMRMDPDGGLTAADILNNYSEREIADILYRYGEERRSRQIARAVVERRAQEPWKETGEFAELVERIVGHAHQHGLPPATRSFQALRIAVNDELGELERGLAAAEELLNPGGVLAVITFHSLEDRIVKHAFLHAAATCVCPPHAPFCTCGKVQTMEILTRKPIRPGMAESLENPRAACSKLRAARRI